MRILGFLLLLAIASMASFSPSYAGDGFWSWNIFGSKMGSEDFEPYIGGEKIKQRSLWDGDDWTPQDWIHEEDDKRAVMRDLYEAKIITGQYTGKQKIPVLEVGEPFTQLSGFDQRRVLEFVDYVFGITTAEENGSFWVYFEANKSEPMGLYNKHGFQSY